MVIKHAVVKAPLQTLAAVADWNADHTGNLNHGTELTNVTPDQHHAQSHNAASHTDIASTGAQIDDAVSKKHTQGTDTTLGAMTAAIDMNTHQINNVVDPTLNQDAATKKYVDDLIPGVGTSYWSCTGVEFKKAEAINQDNAYYHIEGGADANQSANVEDAAGGLTFIANITGLPNGAVITGVVVYGSDTAEDWIMYRKTTNSADTVAAMASAVIGTEDNTINNATIDNSQYAYFIQTSAFGGNDRIYGARITYTL